jgi:plasmid stabilization system protein ParE
LARIIYSQSAIRDFERFIEFALDTAPEHAGGLVEIIKGAISILEHHPLIGRKRDQHRRELVVSRGRSGYVAIYRYDATRDIVFVLRIRHQREAGFAE